MKGNEKDCICHKPNEKHTRRCDAFRLSEFEKEAAGIMSNQEPKLTPEEKESLQDACHSSQVVDDQFGSLFVDKDLYEAVAKIASSRESKLLKEIEGWVRDSEVVCPFHTKHGDDSFCGRNELLEELLAYLQSKKHE